MNNSEILKNSIKMKKLALEGIYNAQSGHPGGSLSAAEIVSTLFFKYMNVDINNPKSPERDRFVLSKGHAAPIYYSALALKGFFDPAELKNLRDIDSFLQGHPCLNKIPGVDMSTGSLGQGLSASNGMALIGKITNKDYRVYCVCGDGEIQEGQIWEAAMTASHYKLDNLTVFIDYNNLQIDGEVSKVMDVYPIAEKFQAFGFNTLEIDGHDIDQICNSIETAQNTKGKPTAIICKTIKGKGISFMEDVAGWHGVAPDEEKYKLAILELDKQLQEII